VTPTVAVREVDGPPILPPNPGDLPTASRTGKGWVITAWVTVGLLVAAALIVALILSAYNGILKGVGAAAEVATQEAAAAASSADGVAKSHGIPDGALTLALLTQQRLGVNWLPSNVQASFSATHIYVSVGVAGDHVVTAADPGVCIYGLTVSSSNDPIIGQDQLPGVGTYWAIPVGAGSSSACSADSAPTSGWEPADRSAALKQIITPTKG
jgi:hypothetical protein